MAYIISYRDSYNRLEWRTLRDPRFTKQCRLLQRGGLLAAHDARTPDHLYATMIHFQQRSQSSFQFLCLSLNQPNFSLSRCCAVLSYPRAARCPCRRRRSHFLPVPRGVLSLRPRATCAQARLYLEHTTATGRGEHHDTTRIMTSSPASSNIKYNNQMNNNNTCTRPPGARSRSRYRTCACRSLAHSHPPPPAAPRRTSPHHAHSALDHTTHK